MEAGVGPGDSTPGGDPAGAIAEATALDRRLGRSAGPTAMPSLGSIFTEYVADGCSR